MTQTYFPFDSGQGANVTESQWSKMAQYWLNTGVLKGVLNELQVYADSTGLQVKVKSGRAWIQGHFFESDTEEILPISTANTTNPRIDRVIIRLDWTANTIQLAVLQGVPATSPVVPSITQNTSRWEVSLAQVYVGTNATTIAAGNITDDRIFSKSIPYFYKTIANIGYGTSNALQQMPLSSGGSPLSNGITLSGDNISINTDGVYQIDVDADISGLGSGQTYELFIRAYKDGVTYGDYGHLVRGNAASAGLNLDTFWSHNSATVKMQKGGYFQILVRLTESPRTINNVNMTCKRISD